MDEESGSARNDCEERRTGSDVDMRAGSRGVTTVEVTRSDHLRKEDPELNEILSRPQDVEEVRAKLFDLLFRREQELLSERCAMDDLERANALQCIRVLKNIFSGRSERMTGHSAVATLLSIVRGGGAVEVERRAFFTDISNIAKGSLGRSDICPDEAPSFLAYGGREGARIRSDYLDRLGQRCEEKIGSYRTGLEPEIVEVRKRNRDMILDVLGGTEDDWNDHRWHQRNALLDLDQVSALVDLTEEEAAAIDLAVNHHLPFGITPYYLSLFDPEPSGRWDHAVRAQVIPPLSYVRGVLESRRNGGASLDFMKEGDTSPVDLVTRRYPMIAILKPYNTCAQICVYCQRNWEIGGVSCPDATASDDSIDGALDWFEDHPVVSEVLVTGGDPALLDDDKLSSLLRRLSDIEHIARIRIGTRLPVVLPMRFTDEFVDSIGRFHVPPEKDLCMVTHFEQTYEVTPEAVAAVQKFRMQGIAVYNQQVFTFENSRKFETAALRLLLKQVGVDPYYTFNTKGKTETNWYRVPIARILQERKEEARLLPGLSRTDEPVFNIPALGKNHLRSWQNHDLITISPQGERVYEFHPWEKNITTASTYMYTDVPILDYLLRLRERGEDPEEYRSIWYYF